MVAKLAYVSDCVEGLVLVGPFNPEFGTVLVSGDCGAYWDEMPRDNTQLIQNEDEVHYDGSLNCDWSNAMSRRASDSSKWPLIRKHI